VSLSAGTCLGAYEVVSLLGEGGMGQVYRAKDTRLKREVALKILPDAFAADPDRVARFQREAELLATLNHPNIAGIYGLEQADGMRALVLELVEGPTLADRLAHGPIPAEEALLIARQIADALEAAHEKGVIHRDLKPANIKLTPHDTVKVLDFGLAKMLEPPGAPAALSMSPTLSVRATYAGVILGTAAYMSPEQARGKAVDKRTDIWAFGCVLFEMLTGKPPFAGEDVAEVIGAIIYKDIEWDRLPLSTPATVRMGLARCLEKDAKQRVRDIGDVQLALSGAFSVAAPSSEPSLPTSPRHSVVRASGVALAVLLAVGAGAAITGWALRPQAQQPVRFAITPPSTQPLSLQGFQRDLAITPDGRHVVYRIGPAGTTAATQLALRSLDQLDARVLTGVSGIRSPFISPDGGWVGFFEGAVGAGGGQLKKVSLLGGPPISLCTYTGNPLEASWGPDDTIIFATSDRTTGLMSVSAGGGEPKTLTTPDASRGELDHMMPFILPGGRTVLFTIWPTGSIDTAQIAVLDLKTGQRKTLIRGGSDARYVETGHLVYAAAGALRAVRFDLGRLEVTSDPAPVVEKVLMSGTTGTADFAVSQNGTLVYVPGGVSGATTRTLAWVNRQGQEEAMKAPGRAYSLPRISPDGTRVALDIRDQDEDIWIWEFKREVLTRFTFDAAADVFPVWTPDSRRIVWGSAREGRQAIYSQAADNTGSIERLSPFGTTPQNPNSISPNGSRLLFTADGSRLRVTSSSSANTGNIDIFQLSPVTASSSPAPLIHGPFTEAAAEISPDGRWVAYQSDENGPFQIFVRPFPEVESGHWQVSTNGGTRPVWARNGRELFYESNGALMAVGVQAGGATFTAGNPVKVLDNPSYFFGNVGRTYDVSPDGQRFLMIKAGSPAGQDAGGPMFVVVEHWTEELKARMGAK
jgi:eukaryotic-like serine/threonine-protein kinase